MKKDEKQHISHPCGDCPFRQNGGVSHLGQARAEEIASSDSFVCHKTTDSGSPKQCAGHMQVCSSNAFVKIADAFSLDLGLSGRELLFPNENAFIEHQSK